MRVDGNALGATSRYALSSHASLGRNSLSSSMHTERAAHHRYSSDLFVKISQNGSVKSSKHMYLVLDIA